MPRPKPDISFKIEKLLIAQHTIEEICEDLKVEKSRVIKLRFNLRQKGYQLKPEATGPKKVNRDSDIDSMLLCRVYTSSEICKQLGVTVEAVKKRAVYLQTLGHTDIPIPIKKYPKIRVDYDMVQHSGQVGKKRFSFCPGERLGDYIAQRMRVS